jgi:hypothetical protein
MSKNRLFKNQPKIRLIVSVETETVAAIDRPLSQRQPFRVRASGYRREAGA